MNITNKFDDNIIITNIPVRNVLADSFTWSIDKLSHDWVSFKESSISKIYTPNPKDKLYFYPGCNVPRFKVREWGKKNKITVTVTEDKANAKFASSKSFYKYVSDEYYTKVSLPAFIKFIEINYDNHYTNYDELISTLDTYNKDYILLKSHISGVHVMLHNTYNNRETLYDKTIEDLDPNYTQYMRYQKVNMNDWVHFYNLCTDPNVYSQQSIIGLINEDSTIINSELYEELKTMLQADDRKNIVMAMEIMASSNLNLSCHYVMLLLRECGEIMYSYKEKNHVNFKSMIEFLNIKNHWTNITEDIMIQTLMDKEVLTMETLTETCEAVKAVMERESNTKHFIISKITVSDEVKNYFKEQAIQQTTQLETQDS
jgi:hypothetical protein